MAEDGGTPQPAPSADAATPPSTTGSEAPDSDSGSDAASADADASLDAEPVAAQDVLADVVDGDVIVVGHDAWTDPVIEELRSRDADVTVLVTDAGVADRLREQGLEVVHADDVDEASFQAADIGGADAVFVATLDEQRNVLAVLTAMNVEQDAQIATFAREASDVSKLEAAGADVVISLGEVVADLLVEVALSGRDVDEVLAELTAGQ